MLQMHLCIATASLTPQIKTFHAQSLPLELLAFCKRYDALTMDTRASFMSWWGSCRARFARSTPAQTIVTSCVSLSIACYRQQLLASTIATKHHSFRALLTHETAISGQPSKPPNITPLLVTYFGVYFPSKKPTWSIRPVITNNNLQ